MLTAMLAAFIGGIILNFMPCVFPVISLKALGLLRHADNTVGARREGLAFLLGVMVTMMLLAAVLLAARAGGVAVGWGFQLQSPLVIALLSLVMLAAALNLLGVFEVGLSAQRVGALDIGRGAFVRSAMTGALAIVVATPCAAPFMASAIGYALVQPPATSLAVFLPSRSVFPRHSPSFRCFRRWLLSSPGLAGGWICLNVRWPFRCSALTPGWYGYWRSRPVAARWRRYWRFRWYWALLPGSMV